MGIVGTAQAVMNEKLAPEILYYQQDVLDEARAAVDAQVTAMHVFTTLSDARISAPPRVDHVHPALAAVKTCCRTPHCTSSDHNALSTMLAPCCTLHLPMTPCALASAALLHPMPEQGALRSLAMPPHALHEPSWP